MYVQSFTELILNIVNDDFMQIYICSPFYTIYIPDFPCQVRDPTLTIFHGLDILHEVCSELFTSAVLHALTMKCDSLLN